MSNLIDRESAICALVSLIVPLEEYHDFNHGVNDACVEIMKLPEAEPEIIHCRDCKFWTHIKRTNRYWCKTDDGLYDLNPSPDDFCSRAERRTNEVQDG